MRYLPNLFAIFLASILVASHAAFGWTVTPTNSLTIDATAVPGITELSGLAYSGLLGMSNYEFFAVQDSGNQMVTLSIALAADGTLSSAAAVATKTLSPGFDFEGIAIGPPGSILVAEETTPAIRRYDADTGLAAALLAMPAVFTSERANFAFESLTRATDGQTYWTANEEALTPDGPRSDTSHGTTARLQQFTYNATGSLELGPQFAYEVDSIHVGATTDARTRSGLSDLVALPDGSLLTLERSLGISGFFLGIPLYQYESRIYHVTFDEATDTSQAPFSAGLAGQAYTPATKSLLWSGQAGGGFGQNLEGLALGPLLPSGDWSLVGVVDSGGNDDPLSGNTVVAFRLAPPLASDFNFDGRVDAADYVVWRKGLGEIYRPEHYQLWAANFAAESAGSGSLATPVPEPAVWRLLLLAALILPWSATRLSLARCAECP